MRRTPLPAAALAGLLLLTALPAHAEETPAPAPSSGTLSLTDRTVEKPLPTDQMIVKYRSEAPAPETAAPAVEESVADAVTDKAPEKAGKISAEVVKTKDDGTQIVDLGEEVEITDLEAAAEELEKDPAVEYAEPDVIVSTSAAANERSLGSLWNMTNIDAPLAWDRATGAGQIIAVVDTGIINHPDLNTVPGVDLVSTARNQWDAAVSGGSRDGNGWDWNPRDEGVYAPAGVCSGSPKNSDWHGTHVAGAAAAEANNGIGVVGAAPQAKVMPVRVLGTCGNGHISDVADGIRWASGQTVTNYYTGQTMAAPAKRADVINLSLNYPGTCLATFRDAINTATANGSVVVNAAGNYNVDASGTSPASCLNTVTVGAAGADGRRANYSNWGWAVDLLAPGGAYTAAVYSTVDQSATSPAGASYGNLQGTSMAAPHVSGAVAAIRELNPGLNVHQIRDILTRSSVTIDGLKHLDMNTAVENTPRARIFQDVDPEGAFAREIHYANRTGLLNGWKDGTFRPVSKIERGAMAAVMYREAGSPAYTAPARTSFRDVPVGAPFYKEIHWAKSKGYLNGWSDGTFRPTNPIARDATAALLYRVSGSPAYSAPAISQYKDIRPGQQFYKEMSWLASKNISTGWSDGTFRALSSTNRDAMAAFLFRWDWEVR
jgi:subtilisin family serine protease